MRSRSEASSYLISRHAQRPFTGPATLDDVIAVLGNDEALTSCFIEFGDRRVGRVDADFLTGPSVVAPFTGPSLETAAEKSEFASSRRERWFGS